jgi:type I restriction enzyme, S subunit
VNKIERLIEELCPEGVQHRLLWQVTAWDKRFNAVDNHKQVKFHKYTYVLAANLKSLAVAGGDVKLLSTGLDSPGWTTLEMAGDLVVDAEIVAIPWGGKAVVHYLRGPFVTADNRIAQVLDKNELSTKFLYYVMLSKLDEIESFYRGSGIRHPDMSKVLDLKIPLPPLLVQQEIVSILDNFTELEAELEAELEGRRKQYEAYRVKLLSEQLPIGVEFKTMGSVLGQIPRGKRLTKSNLSEQGSIPVFHGGLNPIGFHDESNTPGETVMVINTGASSGSVGWSETPFWCSDGCFALPHSKEISSRYLYYFAALNQQYFMDKVRKAGIPTLASESILSLPIPVLPMSKQLEIVGILDKFFELGSNLSEGLPAEIQARHKQYEYYRSKLLTFKEIDAA